MAQVPQNFAPPIPGLTQTDTPFAGGMSPMSMLAMMMGNKQSPEQGSGDKMSQVVQLLREIASQDPKLAMIAGDALKALIEGPQTFANRVGQVPGSGPGPMPGGPMMPGSPIPMGGPGPAPM